MMTASTCPTYSIDWLNFAADRIERVLAAHRIPARVSGGQVAHRWVHFAVLATRPLRDVHEALALALGVPEVRFEALASARVMDSGRQWAGAVAAPSWQTVRLSVPRPVAPVRWQDVVAAGQPWPHHHAALGEWDAGGWATLDMRHNVVVVGAERTTTTLKTLAASLCATHVPGHYRVGWVAPGALADYAGLASGSHSLNGLSDQPASVLMVLRQWVTEMALRNAAPGQRPCLLLVVDDLHTLAQVGGPEAIRLVGQVATHGPAVQMTVLAGARSFPADWHQAVRVVGATTSGLHQVHRPGAPVASVWLAE